MAKANFRACGVDAAAVDHEIGRHGLPHEDPIAMTSGQEEVVPDRGPPPTARRAGYFSGSLAQVPI